MSADWQGDCGDVVRALGTRLRLRGGLMVGQPYKTIASPAAEFRAALRDTFASDPANYTATAVQTAYTLQAPDDPHSRRIARMVYGRGRI